LQDRFWKWDKGVTFSKKGVMKYIDDLFDKENNNPADFKKWKNGKNTPLINIWMKTGGSLHDKKMPYTMIEMTFDPDYTLDQVVKAFFEHRPTWDKDNI